MKDQYCPYHELAMSLSCSFLTLRDIVDKTCHYSLSLSFSTLFLLLLFALTIIFYHDKINAHFFSLILILFMTIIDIWSIIDWLSLISFWMGSHRIKPVFNVLCKVAILLRPISSSWSESCCMRCCKCHYLPFWCCWCRNMRFTWEGTFNCLVFDCWACLFGKSLTWFSWHVVVVAKRMLLLMWWFDVASVKFSVFRPIFKR